MNDNREYQTQWRCPRCHQRYMGTGDQREIPCPFCDLRENQKKMDDEIQYLTKCLKDLCEGIINTHPSMDKNYDNFVIPSNTAIYHQANNILNEMYLKEKTKKIQ